MMKITQKLVFIRTKLSFNISIRTISTQERIKPNESAPDVVFDKAGNNIQGYQGLIELNRPKALNALTLPMVNEIYAKLKNWESSKKYIVITAVGEKAFCAGGDVKSLVLALNQPGGEIHGQDFIRKEYRLTHLIGTYKKPVVTLCNGIVMGGGAGLFIHCKYRVATDNTLFAMPETAIGLCPDVGATYVFPRLQGKLGIFLGLTGYRLRGIDALHSGIATHYVPSDKFQDVSRDLLAPECRDISKVLEGFQNVTSKRHENQFSLAPHTEKINKCFSADTVEEIVSRLKADGCNWSQEVMKVMTKMSPTALKVTKAAFDKGSNLSFADCLKMEYRMSYAFHNRNGDFYEGVRALLIDKDRKPSWKPKTLEEVTDDMVESYFTKIPAPGDLPI